MADGAGSCTDTLILFPPVNWPGNEKSLRNRYFPEIHAMTSVLLEPAVSADRSCYLFHRCQKLLGQKPANAEQIDRILTSIRIDERPEKHETGQIVPECPFRSPHSRAVIRTRPRFGSGGRLAEGRLGG